MDFYLRASPRGFTHGQMNAIGYNIMNSEPMKRQV